MGDAASIFNSMAKNEEKHGQQLSERRQKLFGDRPLRVSRDDIFDVEAPEPGARTLILRIWMTDPNPGRAI